MMRMQWGKKKMETQNVALQEVLQNQTNMRMLFSRFQFVTTDPSKSIVGFIIQCQNTYLSIADKDIIEGKFAMRVIFRYVLICWIYLQLAFAASNIMGGVGK